MKAVLLCDTGGPEVLRLGEVAAPALGPSEVRVRVRAAGLNNADLLRRRGTYRLPSTEGEVLGLEIAGTVVEVGPDVVRWSPGDDVCGLTPGGGYAEEVVLPEPVVMSKPSGLSFVQAAAIPEVFTTAYDNLVLRGGVRDGAGDQVLVHGGAGGVGTAAIQIIKLLGGTVGVTAGSAGKLAACRELGADVAINHREEDFVQAVADLTDGRGVDVVLDHVGGPYLRRNLQCLAMDGRLVLIGTMGGREATLDLAEIMSWRHVVTGSRLRGRTVEEKAELARELENRLWPAFDRGDLRPVVHEVFAIEDVVSAHAAMEKGSHIGKIVLDLGSGGDGE